MLIAIGYFVVLVSVIGSYAFGGGHLGALYQPLEFVLIGGAGLGAFVAGNSKKSMAAVRQAIPMALKGVTYSKDVYMDLMSLLYVVLNKARREGLMSIESHIEDAASSPIFAAARVKPPSRTTVRKVWISPRSSRFIDEYISQIHADYSV